MAHVDPFLHTWDERFHALVAKNMIHNPRVPILRNNPLFPADLTDWSQGSVWLHKQPLFLWQMAVSMKVFGVSEFAARYPSVLMGTLMIPMIFQVIRSITNNSRIALLAAGLFCCSNFHLELVGGIRSMDHNDLCFEFYVLASVWAWIKYQQTQKKYWLILVGIFSGAAVLTKWLIGLFVFLLWGTKILLQVRKAPVKSELLHFLVALLVCCVVFLPWQIYILYRFPAEAAYEYAFNARHITEALEGHEGDAFFYLFRFPQLFGEGIFLLIFPGIYLHFKSAGRNNALAIPVLTGVLFAFVFWSFIVQTKVISHLYFIAPFVLMYMGYSLDFIMGKLKRTYLILPFLAGVGILSCKPEKIIMDQDTENVSRNNAIYNAAVFKKLKTYLPEHVTIGGNVPDFVSAMFYNEGLTVYESFSKEQLEILQKDKRAIFIFKSIGGIAPPEHVLQYPYLYIIDVDIKPILILNIHHGQVL